MSGSMASISEASGLASPAGSSSAWLGLGLEFGLGLHGQGRGNACGVGGGSLEQPRRRLGAQWRGFSPGAAPSQPELSGAP